MMINHVLIRAEDMTAMSWFFKDALGLREGDRPAFEFAGEWLYSAGRPIVHLVEANSSDESQAAYLGSNEANSGTGIVDHIALEGEDYNTLIERLTGGGYLFFERNVPETDEHQVFVHGPEQLKIEILFRADKATIT